MYFDSYITGKRIQQLRKTKGLTQEQFAVKLNISDRHLGKIERGEGTASIDLLVEVAISLNTTLDFLILGVLDTPRERELNAQIKKQHQKIQIFKNKLSNLIDELEHLHLYNHHKEVEKRFSASFFVPFFLTYLRKTGTGSSDFREKFAQKSGKTGTTSSLKRQCFYDKLLSQQGQHPRRGETQIWKPYLEN